MQRASTVVPVNTKLKGFEFHIKLLEKHIHQAEETTGIILINVPFSLLYSGILRRAVKMCAVLGKV